MPSLLVCCRRFDADTRSITNRVALALASANFTPGDREAIVEHAIIRLHDAWAVRVRQLIVLSAIGGHVTASGNVLGRATNLDCRLSPVHQVRLLWTTRPMDSTWEPKWYDPAEAIRSARLLGVRNFLELSAGLGATLQARELRTVRNLIAHRVPNAWQKFRTLARNHPPTASPALYTTAPHPQSGLSPLSTWVADLTTTLRAAVV
jgi:hypothetical protein